MQWDDLKVLLALSRGASVAKAARALRIDETTVSRRLRRIENAVGQRLMERRAAGIEATHAGERLVREAERLETALGATLSELRADRDAVHGCVRLTAVPMIAHRLLAPALGDLLATHPDLSVDLIATPERLDIMQREADIALRFARPTSEQAPLARRIADLKFAIYASAASEPDPKWIDYDAMSGQIPQRDWIGAEQHAAQSMAPVTVGDGETLMACLTAGLGKSWLPCLIADRIPEVHQVAPGNTSTTREVWLVAHPDLKGDPRLKAIGDWVEQIIAG